MNKRKIISDVIPKGHVGPRQVPGGDFGCDKQNTSRPHSHSQQKIRQEVPIRVSVRQSTSDDHKQHNTDRPQDTTWIGSENFEQKDGVKTLLSESGDSGAELPRVKEWQKPKRPLFSPRIKFPKIFLREKHDVEDATRESSAKSIFAFAIIATLLLTVVAAISFVSRGKHLEARVLGVTKDGVDETSGAVSLLVNQEYAASAQTFDNASRQFQMASEDLADWAGLLGHIHSPIPILGQFISGSNAIKAGKYLANAGKEMAEMMQQLQGVDNPLESKGSLLDLFTTSSNSAKRAGDEIDDAIMYLDGVRAGDVPEEYREKFVELKNMLPRVRSGLASIEKNTPAIIDMLGGNGPRKYLFLFQNNHELRATGGFIGSYGLLDIKDGVIRKFFVDGVFNPDGQLKVDIVPPEPIQKISAGWSMHDSNWFLDFPTSAKKAMYFYGKSGGPTVDGVIAFTPEVLRKLLTVTGPIDMPEYGVTVNADNFIETIQQEVEVDYDKEENRPKKILSDLAPILLERVFAVRDGDAALKLLTTLDTSLREKDILLYSSNADVESIYDTLGWSGRVRETALDYLSVVHSNINGYKTDGVIDESISHRSTIDTDGRIVDTVTIARHHNGGDTPYDWWNRVNADYMRVYVPQGSELLSAKGYTREKIESPLNYDALGFERDEDVTSIERTRRIDRDSGTQIFEESGKTVFGNWVYVSPKESVTVEYTYALPFGLDLSGEELPMSLLVQKQPGSMGTSLKSELEYPEDWQLKWKSFDDVSVQSGLAQSQGVLDTDMFRGYILNAGTSGK